MAPRTEVDVVVVGAGIGGLAAAWYLRERDVLVLEADGRVGGRLLSERRGDYWLNYGAHVFGSPATATGHLLDELGVEAAPVPGCLAGLAMNGRVLTDGRVESYPWRIPMSWEARLAVLRAGVKVRSAVWRYGRMSAVRPGETAAERQQRIYDFLGDSSFADFVGPLPPDADAMFRPTVSRSAGSPEQVSAGAGVGYFQLVWDRSAGLSRNIVGGSSLLPEAIGALLGRRLLLGAEAHEVEIVSGGVVVRYDHEGSPQEVLARDVVLATPAPITRRIVVNLPTETAAALDKVVYGSYVSAAFLTNETAPQRWDSCYAIATPKRRFNVMFNMTSLARSREKTRRARQQHHGFLSRAARRRASRARRRRDPRAVPRRPRRPFRRLPRPRDRGARAALAARARLLLPGTRQAPSRPHASPRSPPSRRRLPRDALHRDGHPLGTVGCGRDPRLRP